MDVRIAFRALAKQPAFCLAAILTLTLGVGANSAIFSIFDAVILRPLPYPNPDRLVLVWQKRPDGRQNGVAAINYEEWIKQTKSFDRLEGLIPAYYNVGAGDGMVQAQGARVDPGFLPALGAQPVMGRGFTPEDAKIGAPHVALVNFGLWQSLLGADPKRVGQLIELNGVPYTLIGVLPKGFDFIGVPMEVWTPLNFERSAEMRANKMVVLGLLKPSLSLPQAEEDLRVVSQQLEFLYPEDNKGWGAMVEPLQNEVSGRYRPALTALMVGVGLVLLIACTNVSNLLLARSESRTKEAAIRAALGASRFRLTRQLLMESLILAAAGSIAGLAVAWLGVRLVTTIAAGQLPRIETARLDGRALAFTFAITIVTGVLFALLPVRHFSGRDLQSALRESGRGAVASRSGRRLRSVLVICEVALSLMLAIGAILMARSILWLENENRGFDPHHLLSFRVSMANPALKTDAQQAAFFNGMLERVARIPGVSSVAATPNPPVEGSRQIGLYFTPEGSGTLDSTNRPSASYNIVNADYFKATGIPIVGGRPFNRRDGEDAPQVAIISSTLARRYFAGRNPIGRTLLMANPGRGDADISREIVGVAGDVRYLTRRPEDSAEIYVPYGQTTWPTIYVFVRSGGEPTSLTSAVRAALQEAPWHQPISSVQSVEEWLDTLNGKVRLNSILAAAFAGIALALASIGIYGVISYSVAQKRQEIGVRMALGASPGNILRWIVRQAMLLAAAGVALGLSGHFALAHVMRSILYGTSPNDTSSWLGASALLALTAAAASYIPARRAMRGDPVTALRAE
ncbi:MAG TPA: ABC transporter permease [Bryobacteraceae bacterium]|nr:ABC transporter permease [Bryobacteraceae bacterium]